MPQLQDAVWWVRSNSTPAPLQYRRALLACLPSLRPCRCPATLTCAQAKHGEPIKGGTKRGLRLLTACERLRKLLSTMPEASATAENLIDGIDVPLKLSRDELQARRAPPPGPPTTLHATPASSPRAPASLPNAPPPLPTTIAH
eukprot:5210584-Prymnesium_polylepis.4